MRYIFPATCILAGAIMLTPVILAQTTQPATGDVATTQPAPPSIYNTMIQTVPLNEAEKIQLANLLIEKRDKLDAWETANGPRRKQLYVELDQARRARNDEAIKNITLESQNMSLELMNLTRDYDRKIDDLLGMQRAMRWTSKVLRDFCADMMADKRLTRLQMTNASEIFVKYASQIVSLRQRKAQSVFEEKVILSSLRRDIRVKVMGQSN